MRWSMRATSITSTSPIANTNVFRAWDQDGFQLTQGNLHIERDGTVGFVTDINVGQVANAISAVTHYSNSAPVGGQWIDPTQYYLTYTAPLGSGVSLEAGRFVTLLGAEIIPVYNNQNFNESRGLLFNLGEPLTHTGVRASYTFNDYVSATAGLNNGWDDPAANINGGPNFEGELTLNNKDKSLSLVINGIVGPMLCPGANGKQRFQFHPGRDRSDCDLEALVRSQPDVAGRISLRVPGRSGDQRPQRIVAGRGRLRGVRLDAGGRVGDARRILRRHGRSAHQRRGTDAVGNNPDAQLQIPEVTGLIARLEYRHDNSSQNSFTNNNFVNPATGQQHLWHGQDTLAANFIYAF